MNLDCHCSFGAESTAWHHWSNLLVNALPANCLSILVFWYLRRELNFHSAFHARIYILSCKSPAAYRLTSSGLDFQLHVVTYGWVEWWELESHGREYGNRQKVCMRLALWHLRGLRTIQGHFWILWFFWYFICVWSELLDGITSLLILAQSPEWLWNYKLAIHLLINSSWSCPSDPKLSLATTFVY